MNGVRRLRTVARQSTFTVEDPLRLVAESERLEVASNGGLADAGAAFELQLARAL